MDHDEIMVHALNAQIAACSARIAAMTAENECRLITGSSPAYDEKPFFAEADTILQCANELRARAE